MKVLICGSRDLHWSDGAAIHRRIAALPAGSIIIVGGARGADEFAWRFGTQSARNLKA